MSSEELLLTQAARLKAERPEVKVFVYRNIVKALPWFTTVREKINDPAYAGFFLPLLPGGSRPDGTYYVDPCDHNFNPPRCTTLYHDYEQVRGAKCTHLC